MALQSKQFVHLIGALLFISMLGTSPGLAAPAAGGISDYCTASGGTWAGDTVTDTGTCTYDSSNIHAQTTCAAGERLIETYNNGSFDSSLCEPDAPATPDLTDGERCVAQGGEWDADSYLCTFPANNWYALELCGQNAIATVLLDPHRGLTFWCEATEPPLANGYGQPHNTANSPSGVAILFIRASNTRVIFDAGACNHLCTISASLPQGAADDLPDALATLYVRVMDEPGTPGNGEYTLCFPNPTPWTAAVFKFSSGQWLPYSNPDHSDPHCIAGRGHGSYALRHAFFNIQSNTIEAGINRVDIVEEDAID